MGIKDTDRAVRLCHMDDSRGFESIRDPFEAAHRELRLSRAEVNGELALSPEHGGMRVYWIYRGEGEVWVEEGLRTKEGDGQPLPDSYAAEAMPAGLAACLDRLESGLGTLHTVARPVVEAILSRRRDGAYLGEMANELWKLEHQPKPWSSDAAVSQTILALTLLCRESGFSRKQGSSFERVFAGDQLVVAGSQELRVRGSFCCLTLEHTGRPESHASPIMRLRYLRDSSGGCNVDFDPFPAAASDLVSGPGSRIGRWHQFREQSRREHSRGELADPFPPLSGHRRWPSTRGNVSGAGSRKLRSECLRSPVAVDYLPGLAGSDPV